MPEFNGTLLTVLTVTCLALLIANLALMVGLLARVGRLEGQLRQGNTDSDPAVGNPPETDASAGGAFELFLSEDSSRRELTKGEQFAAYRKWRQEKGMNWSNS
jgi:hypothetical protein